MEVISYEMFKILALFWGPALIAFIIHEQKKKKKAIHGPGWEINKGTQPALFNVDVVLKSGKSRWHVPAKQLLWATSIDNPIVKFRKTKAV
jgi:hypothetical protein